MSQIKWIKNEIETVNNFKNLCDIYGEIASIRMMKIRETVLKKISTSNTGSIFPSHKEYQRN